MKSMIRFLAAASLLGLAVPAQADVVIGTVLPLSGVNASGGEDLRRGMELAVKEINAKGGVLGEPLRIIYEDSGNNPQRAIDAARKLVSVDKVAMVVGEYSSGITIPLGPVSRGRGHAASQRGFDLGPRARHRRNILFHGRAGQCLDQVRR